MKNMVLLEAQVWKRIVALSLLSFSHFFYFYFFGGNLWPLFFIWASLASFIICKVRRLIPTCEGFIVSIILFSHGNNAIIMKIITLLFTYNSKGKLQLDTYDKI